jgi:hypothetical protein
MELPSISDKTEKDYIIAFKSAAAKRRFLENTTLGDRLISDSDEDDTIVVHITWNLADEISTDKKNVLYVKERQPGALYLRADPEEQARRKLGYSQYIPYVRNEMEARGKRLKEISAIEALQLVDKWYRNRLSGNVIYATKAPTQLSRGHIKGVAGAPIRRQEFVQFWISTETLPSNPEDVATRKINTSMRKHVVDIRDTRITGLRKIPATEAVKTIERGKQVYGMRTGTGATPYMSFFVHEKPAMISKTTAPPRERSSTSTFTPLTGLDAAGIINEEYFSKILPRTRLSSSGTTKESGGEGFKFRSAQPTLSSAYLRPNAALGMVKQGLPVYGEQDDSGKWVAFYSKPQKALLKRRKKGKTDFTTRLIRMVLG